MKPKFLLTYFLIFIFSHIVAYFFAGIISNALGVFAFYPPSPTALSYLRNPHDPIVWKLMFPAQILRASLYAIVFLPLFKWIKAQGQLKGGLIIGSILFFIGYVAASGGLIEHEVFFTEYPLRFALISLLEIATYSFVFGQLIIKLTNKYLYEA